MAVPVRPGSDEVDLDDDRQPAMQQQSSDRKPADQT
jgi:hypothetical protein